MFLPKEEGPEYEVAGLEAAAVSPLGRREGFAALVAFLVIPTLVKGDPGWAAGCEAAACAADVVPPRLKVGGLLADLVLGRALAKSGSPTGLEGNAATGCEEAGCAVAIDSHMLG